SERYKLKRKYLQIIHSIFSIQLGKLNLLHLRAAFASKKLFQKYKFHKQDLVIFPSADYYGVKAFLKQLAKMKVAERPRVHLRFIGVLELRQSIFFNSLIELITLINANFYTITVSTEVPIYADYLNTLLPHHSVIAEPYPVLEIPTLSKYTTTEKKEDFFTIVLPGSNRLDKGYFELYHLAKEILYPFPKIHVLAQDMKEWDKKFNKAYQFKLSQLPNVTLLDAILSKDTIQTLYEKADLILLPYHSSVYHYRGSAIHYEAILHGVPVLAQRGSGFIGEIESWSSGWTYETKQELFSCLEQIMSMDQKSLQKKMQQAMLNYWRSINETNRILNLP
ncbi:MAG: hypothetical protein AAF518_28580, partial [Spirochaetota bacterium]